MNRFILNYLGVFFILLSVLSFFNIIYSYYFNLYLNIDTYFYTFLISAVIGVSSFIKNKIEIKINIYSKIFTVIIGYFLLPLIISIPYYFSIYNLSFLNCYFESISGFTSTGFTVFENIKHLDQSLILWRSTSQWIGGIYAVNIFIKDLDNKDPKEVVIDEFIGQSIPICLYEIAHEAPKETSQVLTFYFIMFILFRIFDIAKPYPVSYYDKNFKNSFGVIMDDVCAGLYVVAVLVLYMVISS